MAKNRSQSSDAELVELIRYAVLESGDFDHSDEFSATIHSTWYLLNPLGVDGRDSMCSFEPYGDGEGDVSSRHTVSFTAHAHHGEPHTASPDDLVIYSSMNGDTVNFITDGFNCKKIL